MKDAVKSAFCTCAATCFCVHMGVGLKLCEHVQGREICAKVKPDTELNQRMFLSSWKEEGRRKYVVRDPGPTYSENVKLLDEYHVPLDKYGDQIKQMNAILYNSRFKLYERKMTITQVEFKTR